jgi:tRNA(His) 5'-end guanylyltransferase
MTDLTDKSVLPFETNNNVKFVPPEEPFETNNNVKFVPPEEPFETNNNVKFVPPEAIGERMKIREHNIVYNVEPWQFCILRYDGHSFSKFTSGFKKPFDDIMKNAMQQTMVDTVDKFSATTGYVQSDEITLVYSPLYNNKDEFNKDDNKRCHIFNGKKDKLISVIAGYISARFNYYIMNEIKGHESGYKESFVNLINSCHQHFDGRLLVFDASELDEVLNYFVWRKNDCLRNCVSAFARYKVGPKKVMYKKFHEMVQIINESEPNFDSINSEYKYGVFAKKRMVTKKDIDRKTGEDVEVIRTQVDIKVLDICVAPEYEGVLINKYWD